MGEWFVLAFVGAWIIGTAVLGFWMVRSERRFNRLLDAQDEAIALTRQPPEDTEQWEGWAWEDGHL